MTDATLRSHERAAAQGGPAEQASLLRARVRAGTLSESKLMLAAWCGDEASVKIKPPQIPTWAGFDLRPDECSLNVWLPRLSSLAADVDVGVLREALWSCGGEGTTYRDPGGEGAWLPCCSGVRTVPWPGGEWIMLRAVWAAGLAVLNQWEKEPTPCGCPSDPIGCVGHEGEKDEELDPIRKALDACKVYLDTGTLAAREAWSEAWRPLNAIQWVPAPTDKVAAVPIQAAARELGDKCGCGPACSVYDCVGGKEKAKKVICADLVTWAL